MLESWRWFGPNDVVSLTDIAQAGATGIVSALHHVPTGIAWSDAEIAARKRMIETHPDGRPTGLHWAVVESVPVSEDIKTQTGEWRGHLDAYRETLAALGRAGIGVVCYNFMPVLDWTRTDLARATPTGATAMVFDAIDFAAFDLHLLARANAAEDYSEAVREAAARRIAGMSEAAKRALADNVLAGLPGAAEHWDVEGVRAHLARYDAIGPERLRANFFAFLEAVVPAAEEAGVRLCCHPDDPPFPLLGLPRIVSTLADYQAMLAAVDSPANGVTFCTGSLGARADNDVPAMARTLAPRIVFAHLRNVSREPDGSFAEVNHLEGDVDMVAVIAALLGEEARRRDVRDPHPVIPMRPDHGHVMLDDFKRPSQPGYPAIGRLRGLAELRGVATALSHRSASQGGTP
ncbi:mannonate dehydratase [Salinarimonas ramus]|uniref:Mannonate dehydratase n=1 Tax=Salinarimonas ramus TaxID=690164 RepID=A0A917Q4J8_9HYPH|nr:mannonate dehydratase [Salinarimonas ramus]GGK21871.1 mannonate dehydratase [Salinarimonas ramus]